MDAPLPRRHAQSRGFTLIELMVATFLSSAVLLSVYFVFISNTKQYYVQEQIVRMQESMRFGMEYLKNDVRNAGRLTVANGIDGSGALRQVGRDPQFCAVRSQIRGLQLFEDDRGSPDVLSRYGNGHRPDRLRLLTDASGATPLLIARAQRDRLTLMRPLDQPSEMARDLLGSEGRFEQAFRPGFYLYVVTRSGDSDLLPIAETRFDINGSTIQFQDELCPRGAGTTIGDACFAGECYAAPVQLVEYAVATDRDDPEKTILERRVIDARNGTIPIPELTLVVAEYVIQLQVWGTFDTRDELAVGAGPRPPGIVEDLDPTDDRGNWPGRDAEAEIVNERPERLRAVNILVATRTPREDPDFKIAPDRDRNIGDRILHDLTWFELDDTPNTGFARVATLRSEVGTPNLFRGR
jgi:prepilin-type N-terminal cleavage/methylation domain-containing protein